jgi:LPXTG-motif cell wall-anchored protein
MPVPFLLFALLFAGTAALRAQVPVTAYAAGTAYGIFFPGESFTTPAGGPWHNITFNFFSDVPAATPSATGTAYLLTQAYTGTPAGLSSSVAGFVAASTGVSSGKFVFAPSVTLQPNTQYFVYVDSSMYITGSVSAGSSGAYLFAAVSSTLGFGSVPTQLANFQVLGAVVASAQVPVLSTPVFILLGMMLASAGALLAGRRKREAI